MFLQELAAQPHIVQHFTDTYVSLTGGSAPRADHLTALLPAAEPSPQPTPGSVDDNPFAGLKPKWSVLGPEFNGRWIEIVGAVWALAIAACGFFLLRGIVSYGQHRGSQHPAQVAEARGEMTNAGIALGGVLMFGLIMGLIVKVAG